MPSPAAKEFPRLSELEDAIEAREGLMVAFSHTLIVQSMVMLGIIHARAVANELPRALLEEGLAEVAERLVTLSKVCPGLDPKSVAAMLGAFQSDLKDRATRAEKGN